MPEALQIHFKSPAISSFHSHSTDGICHHTLRKVSSNGVLMVIQNVRNDDCGLVSHNRALLCKDNSERCTGRIHDKERLL
jgi:hypothetical protein